MGKASTASAAEMKRTKKKGRPPKNSSPLYTHQKTVNFDSNAVTGRRSNRRNPRNFSSLSRPEFDDDDDDERKEKKVKLVVRLPELEDDKGVNLKQQQQQQQRDQDSVSGSGSDSDRESGGRETQAKKRKINAGDGGSVKAKEAVKATDASQNGLPLDSGPTTPLPDKKLLVFILDRLQKKDTHGAFSEPVDADEVPGYFEVIEEPMDFGTIRNKLDTGAYRNLEELEVDVFLICSNAMEYNARDTVFYRQARAIQELAKRDFENLRHEGDNGEPQPKIVRRGRPPGTKNIKKSLEASAAAAGLSSEAKLGNVDDKTPGSGGYNLRKAPALNRFKSNDQFVSSYRPRNGENYSEWLADWNQEFPASILRADTKYGKKQFIVDETRRETYREFHPLPSSSNARQCGGDTKQLVPVGFQEPLAYASSLARFAANLGPVAWKIASNKIESVLPAGVQYGPGWVDDVPATTFPSSFSTEKQKSSNSSGGDGGPNNLVAPAQGLFEAFIKNKTQNEQALHGDASPWKTPFPAVQRNPYQPHRNGFTGTLGCNIPAKGPHTMIDPVSFTSHMTEPSGGNVLSSAHPSATNHFIRGEEKLRDNWNAIQTGYQTLQPHPPDSHGLPGVLNSGNSFWQLATTMHQQQQCLSSPPDLNVRIPVGSPNSKSNLQIDSPRQPDLALQL